MKPRRTFEAVVTELIDGFRSGEIVLEAPSSHSAEPSIISDDQPKFDFPVYCTDPIEQTVVEDYLKSTVVNAKYRVWLLVGELPKAPLNLLLDLNSYAQKSDIRVVITNFNDSEKVYLQLKNNGLAPVTNVRLSRKAINGWLAIADQTLFIDNSTYRKCPLWRKILGTFLNPPANSCHKQHIVFVEERSDPEKFHYVERLFDSLWNSA